MQITRIEWIGVRVPFRRPLVTAQVTAEHRYALLLLLGTDAGVTGLGEASPVGAGSPAELRRTAGLLPSLAPNLLNVTISEALEVASSGKGLRAPGGKRRSGTPSGVGGGPEPALAAALRFGLETALYDVLGKESGSPVAALLGGEPRPVAVNALIGVDSAREATRLAKEAVDQGFSTVKLKIGGRTPEEDVALVRAVREAVGAAVRVRVDANGSWSVEEAIATISRLEEFDLEYVEQPVAAKEVQGMAQVRRSVRVPIAADESLAGLEDAQRLLDADAADVFVIKATRAGGLQPTREIMGLVQRHGRAAVVTSSLETGVGIAASLHLAASAPGEKTLACGLATADLLEHDLLVQPLAPTRGELRVLPAPGLGVELDMEAVRRYSMGVQGVVSS